MIAVCSLTSTIAMAAGSDAKPPPPAAQAAFAEGKQLYDSGDKKNAVEKFKEAYRLSSNALLLYNIAFVYDELGDATLAAHYYRLFLDKAQANPKAEANRKLASERMTALEAQDKADKAAAAASEEKAAVSEKPQKIARATSLQHECIEEAPAGKAILVAANAPASWKLALYFRRAGDEEFQMVPLSEDPQGRMVAQIPAKAVTGGALHYYIEAKDPKGAVVGHSGEAASPNLVEIAGTATPAAIAASEAENPLDGEKPSGGSDTGTGWTTRKTVKWGATGAAALALGGGLMAYITWGNYRQTLKDELKDRCGDMPCAPMTSYELELRDGRDMWKMINWVGMGAGVAFAGVAGYLWYTDLRDSAHSSAAAPKKSSMAASPMVAPGYLGASASLEF